MENMSQGVNSEISPPPPSPLTTTTTTTTTTITTNTTTLDNVEEDKVTSSATSTTSDTTLTSVPATSSPSSSSSSEGVATVETSTTTTTAAVPVTATPPTSTHTGRRPRFGTGSAPSSPYVWIDGKQVRSALAFRKRWPPRRVSFPSNDTHLVTGYLEPANPWEHAENVSREDLISTYKKSCIRHNTDPLESVVKQLEKLDINQERSDELSLKGETLEQNHCEPLEEILKRVQFNKIDLEGTCLDDESSVALFDMLEYYESATHLNISCNQNIGVRGWQACSRMIKKTQCLEQLEAKNVTLNDQHMPILSRALRLGSHLHILKLENCGLAGKPIGMLAGALKFNTGLKELYLADNDLGHQDAMQLGTLLRTNNHLQLLDVSNNNIQDVGMGHITDGLIEQLNDDKDGKGLGILVLWNNHLTRNSSQHFSRVIARSKTLETLNIGQNILTNEMLFIIKDSLQQNRTLLQLGMQSTHLTCEGAIALAEIIEENRVLQRIDLRDNVIQSTGLKALSAAMKINRSVTQLDLDDKPRVKIDMMLHQYRDMVAEIRSFCTRNEEPCSTDNSTEDSESPQHRSRLSSVSSRKISLTCQTLPRSPPPIPPIPTDGTGRSLLEPKRTSGGRLRSPAPSPVPSPVASPTPSPSRSRFVVSRVPEASLSSTNSSASSSPITPPSLGSSPTRFFPVGSSRFRVTVVECTDPVVKPKSVVASTNANITVGFKYKVDDPEHQEGDDDVFKPEEVVSTAVPVEKVVPDSIREVTVKVKKTGDNRCVVKDIINNETEKRSESSKVSSDEPECLTQRQEPRDSDAICQARTGNQNENPSGDVKNPDSVSNEANSTSRKASLQKHTSSLEKLLSLFQHPGSLFCNAGVDKVGAKNPIQDGVNSMVALGDKFQQYLRDGRGTSGSRESSPQPPLQRSSSDASQQTIKQDPVKSMSVPQLSNIQALTNVFASCKLEPDGKLLQDEKDFNCNGNLICTNRSGADQSPLRRLSVRVDNQNNENTTTLFQRWEDETTISRFSDHHQHALPENVQSKEIARSTSGDESTAPTEMTDSDLVNNSVTLTDSKPTSLCSVPKLMDIPEYSVLEISDKQNVTEEVIREPEVICDSSQADSINTPSDRHSSSPCSIRCDIRNIDSVVDTLKKCEVTETVPELHQGVDLVEAECSVALVLNDSFKDDALKAEEKPQESGSNLLEDDLQTSIQSSTKLVDKVEDLVKPAVFERSDTEDLIFSIMDISADTTFLEDDLSSPGGNLSGAAEDKKSSSGNLYIDKSRNVHRNSHDSGIEETNASISEDVPVPESPAQPRESFQESVDSGIDSECSSVGTRIDSTADSPKDQTLGQAADKPLFQGSENSLAKSKDPIEESNVALDRKTLIKTESHTRVEIVKSMVVTSVCTKAKNTVSDVEVDPEEQLSKKVRDSEKSTCTKSLE